MSIFIHNSDTNHCNTIFFSNKKLKKFAKVKEPKKAEQLGKTK